MARLRVLDSADTVESDGLYRTPSVPPPASAGSARGDSSSSPSPSESSDKENHTGKVVNSKGLMGPPMAPASRAASLQPAAKRRRLSELQAPNQARNERQPSVAASTTSTSSIMEEMIDYDPNQNIDERREVRRNMRGLAKDISERKSEWLAPDSTGLRDAVMRSSRYFKKVKQTSDATIDSRFLVNAGDMAYKKTTLLVVGDGAQGVDVDDFVTKCINFMRQGDNTVNPDPPSATQRRRNNRASGLNSDDEDEHEQGDGLNWEWLGAQACLKANSRPAVPGFLLGPLSLQRRIRGPRVRKEPTQRTGPVETTKPQELKAADLANNENSNLKAICHQVYYKLKNVIETGSRQAEEEVEAYDGDLSTEQEDEILERNNICENQGVSLFRFAFDPHSFGQTVENLFYVSFLIKEGKIGIEQDGKGMPTLHSSGADEQSEVNESKGRKSKDRSKRHQAILSLSYDVWLDIKESLEIRESILPHRAENDNGNQVTANGWYA